MVERDLTTLQSNLAVTLTEIFSLFGIPATPSTADVLSWIAKHCLEPQGLDPHAARAANIDMQTATALLTCFDMVNLPRNLDTVVVLEFMADKLRHKIDVPQIGFVSPGSNTVN